VGSSTTNKCWIVIIPHGLCNWLDFSNSNPLNLVERDLIGTPVIGGFNLGRVMRHLIVSGTPRGLQDRPATVIAAL
jgi:hypothetical protein